MMVVRKETIDARLGGAEKIIICNIVCLMRAAQANVDKALEDYPSLTDQTIHNRAGNQILIVEMKEIGHSSAIITITL